MTPVGFEPTQFALVELESTPLDHSGKVSFVSLICRTVMVSHRYLGREACVVRTKHTVAGPIIIYSLRGLNPRPMAHKTIALTTELRELEGLFD